MCLGLAGKSLEIFGRAFDRRVGVKSGEKTGSTRDEDGFKYLPATTFRATPA